MWNDILLHFNDDETINIGLHNEELKGNNVYESHSIATIKASEEVKKNPNVISCASNQYIIVAIDSEVAIFEIEERKLVCILTYESPINTIALHENYPVLITAEQDGLVHMVYIPTWKKLLAVPLVTRSNVDNFPTFKSMFFPENVNGNSEVVVLSKMNQLFLFSNLHVKNLCEAIISENDTEIQKIISNISRKSIDLSLHHSGFDMKHSFSLNLFSTELILGVFGTGDDVLGLYLQDNQLTSLLPNYCIEGEIKKVQCTQNGRHIIILDDKKHLYVVCTFTLLIVNKYNINIEDFLLMEFKDSQKMDNKMAVLKYSEPNWWFQICLIPSLDITYNLRLSEFAVLVSMPSIQDSVYIIEGLKTDKFDEEFISQLQLKSIEDTLPERRLSHLISKRKFDEAENFAKLFHLDIEEVHKARLTSYLEDLSPWKSEYEIENVEEILISIKNTLYQIKDKEYIIQWCLHASLPSLQLTNQLLLFAKDTCSHSPTTCKEELLEEINCNLHRLKTFQMLYKNEEWLSWFKFARISLMTEFLTLMNTNRIDKAFFLWERHQDEISYYLNENNIEKILQCISTTLPSMHLVKWFEESFIPNVYHNSNESLEIIAKWLIERVHMMEITENSVWPQNGITLLKTLPNICDSLSKIYNKGGFGISTKLNFHILQQKIVDPSSNISHLINLIDDLEKILTLKMHYKCYVSLSEFSADDKESVVFLILDRLLGEETIKKGINDFLYPYMKENFLKEEIFVKYIQDVLQFSQFSWWYWEEAPWEEKIISIITCIQNEDCKLNAIIRTLSQAPLPWSLGIQRLYEEGLSTSCNRNNELKIQKQLVQLKTILIKYELRNYNFNEAHGAQRLVNYILSLDRPSAMDDALEVVKSYDHLSDIDAYLFRLKFLLREKRHDEFSDLLTSIAYKKAIMCGCRLIYFIKEILEAADLWCDKDGEAFLINMKLGALYTLNYLQRIDPEKFDFYQQDLYWIEHSFYIQLEFGLSLSLIDLNSKGCCNKILNEEIQKFFSVVEYFENFSVDDRKGQKQKSTYSGIFRLGELLGFEKHQTLQKLVLKAIEVHKVDIAFDLISMLMNVCNVHSTETVFETLEHFCRNMETIAKASNKVSELPVVLHNLFSQLMANCKPSLLEKCLDYCHWTSLLVGLHSLTMPHDLEKTASKMDRYYQWKFSPLYQDRGLRILPSQMIPYIQRCLMFHISTKTRKSENLDVENTINGIKEYFYNGKLLIEALRGKCQGEATLKAIIKLLMAFLDIYANAEILHDMELNKLIQMYHSSSILDIVRVLLYYILSSQTNDLAFALGVICIVQAKEAMFIFKELMKMSENDIKSLLSITALGVSYAQINCLSDIMVKFQNYHTQALWRLKLHECNIRFDNTVLSFHRTEKRLLLNELVQKCQINKDTIQEYCTTFNLLLDDVIVAYFEETFLKLEILEILYENDSFELSKEGKEVFHQANNIISMAENPAILLETLSSLVDKIDFYCYEVLLFLKNHIARLSNIHESVIKSNVVTDIEVLSFLQNYQRISKPTEYEISLWLSLHPQCDKLPEISKRRLPYHPLMRPEKAWNIIDNELSISTVNMWLSVSSLIQVPKDDLVVVALQKTVMTWNKNHENIYTKWDYRPPDYRFLSDLEILNQIISSDKAIACFNWIIEKLPAGQTRTLAAKLFIKFAESWMESCRDKSVLKSSIHKLNIKYHKLAMEDILHTFALNKTEYAALSNNPTELIINMWEDVGNHNVFFKKSKVIHQACKRIAELNKCDLSTIYSNLMNRFLIPTVFGSQSADESFSFDMLDFSDDEDKDEINLQKVIHLLHQGNTEDNTIHLLNIGLKNTLSSNSYRARALRCLFSIIDANTITTISGYKSGDLWELLKVLYCLAELENLHIPHTADSFEKMDKVELVEAILTFNGHFSKALQFASSLCLEYKLWNKQLWSVILRNMREIGMYEELRRLLRLLGKVAHIWYNEDYIEAWKYVLFFQFKYDFNRENEDKLLEVFTMLLRCPCVSAIDLEALSEEFRSHKLVVPALAVLLFEKGFKAKEIKKFLKIVPIESIYNELIQLKNKGFNLAYFTQVYEFLNYKEVN